MTLTGIMSALLACLQATSMEIVNTMRDLLHLNPLYGEQFRTLLSLSRCTDSPEDEGLVKGGREQDDHIIPPHFPSGGSIDLQDMSRLVDAAASLTSADDVKLQSILEQINVPDRWDWGNMGSWGEGEGR